MNKFTSLVQIGLLTLFVCAGSVAFAADNSANSEAEMQTVPIKGTVSDADGEPIIGATVVVSGSSTGSTTGIDGEYAFSAPVGSVIEVEFLGYKKATFTVTRGQSVYNVSMESDALLVDEVVVTALGISRESKAIGYAMTEIKGDEVAAINSTSPVAALQGKAAGLSIVQTGGGVMSSSRINIRGISTINGENQPIFVVDGVILESTSSGSESDESGDFGNQLKNLNADDFESVTVLKGAAATALYGSRGIDGAIVITTKSGKTNQNLGVSFSQVTGMDVVYRTPDFQNTYGSGRWAGGVTYVNSTDGTINKWDNTQPYYELYNGEYVPSLRNQAGYTWGPKISDVQEIWGGKIIDFDGEVEDYQAYPNNMKDAYQTGFNTSTNISLQGGGEKTSFYISDTYYYSEGTFPGNTFDRNNLLVKGSYQVTDKLRVEGSISYANSVGKNPPFDFGRRFWYGDFTRDYNTDKYEDLWQTDHGGVASSSYGDKYGNVPGMDMWFKLNTLDHTQTDNMITPVVKLNYKITDYLSLNGEANMNYKTTVNEKKTLGQGYMNSGSSNDEGGQYVLGHSTSEQRSARATINFNKEFGDFGVSLIGGGEWYSTISTATSTWTTGGLIVPGQFFLTNSKSTVGTSASVSNTKDIYSVFFLASFDWKDQLFLDVTGRNDWSSSLVYSNATGNYSYFYPSVSASWLFSDSFDLPEWMTYGKLRASWAQVGNDTDAYYINSTYGISSILYQDGSYGYTNSISTTLVDPDLKPERKTSIEFGTDLRFIDNRIGLDLTYYKENTKDQILTLSAASESGVSNQIINAGNIQNQGWEVAINTTPIQKKNFQWDLNFIYTRNRNKILYLHEDLGGYYTYSSDYGSGGAKIVAYEGGSFGEVLTTMLPKTNDDGETLLQWNSTYRGAYMIRNGSDEVSIGDINPNFEGSLSTSFRFHGVTISASLDARFGGYFESWSSRYATQLGYVETSMAYRDAENGGIEFTSAYEDSYGISYEDGYIPDGVFQDGTTVTTPDGNTQDVAGMSYQEAYERGYVEPTHAAVWHIYNNSWANGMVHDDWICTDLKYIALRNVSVGYTLPSKVVKKMKMSNFHISLDGYNVCYLYSNMPNHINPESSGGSSKVSAGEVTFSPYTATYSLAIRFNL